MRLHMDNQINKLNKHLDDEIRLYQFYFTFLQNLQAEIIQGNSEAIDEMIRNIRFSERDFNSLKKERDDILKELLGDGKDIEFSHLSDLFTDDEYRIMLEKKNYLNELIEDVRHYNEVNKIILENALSFTRQRLDHFKTPVNDSYTKTGKSKEKTFKNSVNWSV